MAIMSMFLKLHPAFLTMRMGRNETGLVDNGFLSHFERTESISRTRLQPTSKPDACEESNSPAFFF